MICPPCAQAADTAASTHDQGAPAAGHRPEICRDHNVQPAGCPCGHRPVQPAHPEETP